MFATQGILTLLAAGVTLFNVAPVNADWTADLTPCALQCAEKAANITGCELSDIRCLCKSDTFLQDFVACVKGFCLTPEDTYFVDHSLPRLCDPNNWIWQLPNDCVRDCAVRAAAAAGCDLNDAKCLCNSSFLEDWTECVHGNCGDNNLVYVKDFYTRICNGTITL